MIQYVIAMVLFCMPMLTMSATFVEGKDYEVIQAAGATAYQGGPVHVTEFFSYGCPWCYRLEAPMIEWTLKQGKAIHFSKVPVVFHENWDDYARAFYMLEALSLGKTVHEALFKTIIVDKQPLDSHQSLVDFFTKNGVDKGVAESAFSHSPSIELKLKVDEGLMAKFRINVIPTLVVNHQYKTNLQMAKTEGRLFEVLDYLVHKAATPSLDSPNLKSPH